MLMVKKTQSQGAFHIFMLLSSGEEIEKYAFAQEDGAERKTKVFFYHL